MSLGQGQEVVAEDALDVAAEKGHWVILQVRGAQHCGVRAPRTEATVGMGPKAQQEPGCVVCIQKCGWKS